MPTDVFSSLQEFKAMSFIGYVTGENEADNVNKRVEAQATSLFNVSETPVRPSNSGKEAMLGPLRNEGEAPHEVISPPPTMLDPSEKLAVTKPADIPPSAPKPTQMGLALPSTPVIRTPPARSRRSLQDNVDNPPPIRYNTPHLPSETSSKHLLEQSIDSDHKTNPDSAKLSYK